MALTVTALAVLAPSAATASPVLYLYGPASIARTGSYTYTAQLLAPYANFQWATRQCTTSTVDSCTTAWSYAQGSPQDQFTQTYTTRLVYNCSPETSTFQVRVIASAFGDPAQTAYLVTSLCGSQPN